MRVAVVVTAQKRTIQHLNIYLRSNVVRGAHACRHVLVRHVDHFAQAKVDNHRLAFSLAGALEQEVLRLQVAV